MYDERKDVLDTTTVKRSRSWTARLIGLPPRTKLAVAASLDFLLMAAVAALVVWAAQGTGTGATRESAPFVLLMPLMQVSLLYAFGAYRTVLRFLSVQQILRLLAALSSGAFVYLAAEIILRHPLASPLEVLLFITGSCTLLVAVRGLGTSWLRPGFANGATGDRVVIYGAGHAGAQLAAALGISGQFQPVAFVDDDSRVQGRSLVGLPVLSPQELGPLRNQRRFERILLAMPTLGRTRRRALIERLAPLGAKVMVMPSLEELARGERRIEDLRDVQVEDLLGRDCVAPIPALMDADLSGKNVMVTGAGGSIGAELCRQAVARGARKLVLFELSEVALYDIERELREPARRVGCHLVAVLGSILDRRLARRVLREQQVQTVYHAAAYKHVPLVEYNPLTAIENNVFGTLALLRSALAVRVQNFVLISSDKAVRPTSVMGATKRVCELIVQAHAQVHPRMRSSIVRFGNVLGSSGSVVPLFREQIRKGGPVTVTHPEVTRYFMTIHEAAQLVIQAGALGGGGEVFVLDMGTPVRILDLAERMIRLSGLEVRSEANPEGDIDICIIGLRPGEKLHEELLIGRDPQTTAHSRVFKAQEYLLPWPRLEQELTLLREMLDRGDPLAASLLVRTLAADGTTDPLPQVQPQPQMPPRVPAGRRPHLHLVHSRTQT